MLFLILSYFIVPSHVFKSGHTFIAILFMLSFSLVMTCIIRNIKEEIILARTYKSSILGLLSTTLGLSALQACGLGAPVCGATLGLSLFSSLMPAVFVNFINKHAELMLWIAILFQILTLYLLNCFKDENAKKQKLNNKFLLKKFN